MRIGDKPTLKIGEVANDPSPVEPVTDTPASDVSFDGVRTGGMERPIPMGQGKHPQLIEPSLTDKILPPGTVAADIVGKTVPEALALATDAELASLISTRFVRLRDTMEEPVRLSLGPQFVPIGRLLPGQTRIAIERVREKVALQTETDGFDGQNKPAFDAGQASVPLAIAKPAVAGPGGKVLIVDGNHQAVAAILAGAKSVPLDIVADLQDLDEAAFWQAAEANGWLYLKDMGGAPDDVSEATYAGLKLDPLRYLMSELALKAKRFGGEVVYEDDTRFDSRVWVKLKGPTVDFIEFRLADVLYRAATDPAVDAGLRGDLATRSKTARGVLQDAAARGEIDLAALGIQLIEPGASFEDVHAAVAAAL